MHKLLVLCLLGSGLLALCVAAPVQAMEPASNADLKACLGMYSDHYCDKTSTVCSPVWKLNVTGSATCTQTQETEGWDCVVYLKTGPVDIWSCAPLKGSTCPQADVPCETYENGNCTFAGCLDTGGTGQTANIAQSCT